MAITVGHIAFKCFLLFIVSVNILSYSFCFHEWKITRAFPVSFSSSFFFFFFFSLESKNLFRFRNRPFPLPFSSSRRVWMVTIHALLLFLTLKSFTSIFVARRLVLCLLFLIPFFADAFARLAHPRSSSIMRSCAFTLSHPRSMLPTLRILATGTSVSWVASVYAKSERALVEVSPRLRIALCCIVSYRIALQVYSLISCEIKTITKTPFLRSKDAFDFEAKTVTGGSMINPRGDYLTCSAWSASLGLIRANKWDCQWLVSRTWLLLFHCIIVDCYFSASFCRVLYCAYHSSPETDIQNHQLSHRTHWLTAGAVQHGFRNIKGKISV